MKYVLDLKDYVTKLDSEEKDYNESFYRYYILDCDNERVATVWFSQMEDSGNIYSVSIRLLGTFEAKFDLFITHNDESSYPNEYTIISYQARFHNDEEIKLHIKNLQLVNLIAHTAMDIFKEEEHKQKYLHGALNRLKLEV